ncbi:hypothetical protein SAMN05421763_11529 [[Luteovulum] sphaeroides subsp. megalophilum]|nr:hypothetical protein SAMN05421763_11529 [[Luteovulum] sphaeroides subsp. megalophilum]
MGTSMVLYPLQLAGAVSGCAAMPIAISPPFMSAKPDDIAEEETILDLYKSALGMG